MSASRETALKHSARFQELIASEIHRLGAIGYSWALMGGSTEDDGANVRLTIHLQTRYALSAQSGDEGTAARLRAALVKYGAHTGMCGFQGEPYPYGYRCVCGLYDIIDPKEHLATFEEGAEALAHEPAATGEEAR